MIVHIIKETAWEEAKKNGIYEGDTLKTDGFIHCSLPEQVVAVADYNFKGETGLVLLCIDNDKVNSEIKFEDLYDLGEDYPHIYGPLNIDAVVDVLSFEPKEDGLFQLPQELIDLQNE